MTNMDDDLLREINRLADEEHTLDQTSGGPSQATSDRRREIEVALERCWDLVRQRRARRRAGEDPAAAILRSADVVAHYQQ